MFDPTDEDVGECAELYLEDLEPHDRVTHLFPGGFDRTVAQVAWCGTLVYPPFRNNGDYSHGLCVVRAELRGVQDAGWDAGPDESLTWDEVGN